MLPASAFYEGLFIVAAILFNLFIAGIFIADRQDRRDWINLLGGAWLLLALPLGVVFTHYLLAGIKSGMLTAFGLVFLYMLVEFLLDTLLHYDFRRRWLTHIPYILLEYAALFSLIWIAYQIDPVWSWVVGISFWILMGSLVYLYAGKRRRKQAVDPQDRE